MTKYEYNHNPTHKKIQGGRIMYSTPKERFFLIIKINCTIIFAPLLFIFNQIYWGILLYLLLIVDFMWTEYNIFYNLERVEYFFYCLFGKQTIYKDFIRKLSQYEILVKYEEALGVKLRKSYLNSKKVIFKSKKYNGIIYQKYILMNKNKYYYDINDFNNINDLVAFIKSIKKALVNVNLIEKQ